MKPLEPCPFCGKRLVEAHAFATRTTKTFVHPVDDDEPCVIQGTQIDTGDPKRIAAWNRRAYMAALDPAPGWMPMDSAPGNGGVWAFVPAYNMQCVAWFAQDRWWTPARENGRVAIPAPSHWMPLPEPPAAPMSQER